VAEVTKPDVRAKRGLGPAARRQSLVDAGWHLLVTEGVKAVTIDRVLGELGITRPIFYRQFTDRIDLLVALYERYADDTIRTQEPVLCREDLSIEELIKASRTAYFDMAAQHGTTIRPLVEAAHRDPRMTSAQAMLRARTIAMWNVAVSNRLSNRERELFAAREDVRDAVGTMVELVHTIAVDGATMWLNGHRSRRTVEDVLDVMTAGVHQRLLDFLTE